MSGSGQHGLWTTTAEIEFVRGIGRYKWCGRKAGKHIPRIDALRGYLRGAWSRSNWGAIDKKKVLDAVALEIANEERKIRASGSE
jgi:hypothetical protein